MFAAGSDHTWRARFGPVVGAAPPVMEGNTFGIVGRCQSIIAPPPTTAVPPTAPPTMAMVLTFSSEKMVTMDCSTTVSDPGAEPSRHETIVASKPFRFALMASGVSEAQMSSTVRSSRIKPTSTISCPFSSYTWVTVRKPTSIPRADASAERNSSFTEANSPSVTSRPKVMYTAGTSSITSLEHVMADTTPYPGEHCQPQLFASKGRPAPL
mmetsp:Transcript_31265/g.74255  ORF Transcript_31265/g.74255 Transcript_31265/m.74255 type:complete len:211 (-) Transcript_31265:2671-3303(-)